MARPARKISERFAASDTWFVYVVRCSDGSLYTGIARDVAARLRVHDSGRGARYTRSRLPLSLCAVRRCQSKGDALRLEYSLKQLSKSDKEALLVRRRLAAFARALARSREARLSGHRAGC